MISRKHQQQSPTRRSDPFKDGALVNGRNRRGMLGGIVNASHKDTVRGEAFGQSINRSVEARERDVIDGLAKQDHIKQAGRLERFKIAYNKLALWRTNGRGLLDGDR